MPYQAGDPIIAEFTTAGSNAGAVNADALPTAILTRNGVDDGAVSVLVANVGTGRYRATCTIPNTYVAGNSISVVVLATIGEVETVQVVYTDGLARGALLASDIASAVAAVAVDGTITIAQALSIIGAATAGITFGQSTANPGFKNMSNSKTVIYSTTDLNGNRTAVTLTP